MLDDPLLQNPSLQITAFLHHAGRLQQTPAGEARQRNPWRILHPGTWTGNHRTPQRQREELCRDLSCCWMSQMKGQVQIPGLRSQGGRNLQHQPGDDCDLRNLSPGLAWKCCKQNSTQNVQNRTAEPISGNHRYSYRQKFSIGSLNLELKENKAGEGKLTQKLQYLRGIWRNSPCF